MGENKGSWGSLPPEIQLKILETLLQDGCSVASAAAVSREWQTTIEKHNFARIRMTPSRLRDFGPILYRKRALVQYIWYCFELPRYGCEDCTYSRPPPFSDGSVANNCKRAVYDLFSALSKWEPQGDLLLDISAYSPSDPEHWFPELTFLPDVPTTEECERAFCDTRRVKLAGPGDDQHRWPTSNLPYDALAVIFRPTSSRGDPHGDAASIPLAPAVTGLLFRQQNRRGWKSLNARCVFKCCGGLQELYHEPWRELTDYRQGIIDHLRRSSFDLPLPDQLKRLVLFENFDERMSHLSMRPNKPTRVASPTVSQALARNSLALEHLSAAFLVDATAFLNARQPGWAWPNLRTLALTSRLLVPENLDLYGLDPALDLQKQVNHMLKAAAAAAAQMPSLETMEIWNGRKDIAGLFRYRSAGRGGTAGITWRGTWDLALDEDVVRAWEAVMLKEEDTVYEYRRGRLGVAKEMLDARKIRFHGDAIHHLGLEARVIRPVSLYQMRMERDFREVKN